MRLQKLSFGCFWRFGVVFFFVWFSLFVAAPSQSLQGHCVT